MWRAGGGGVTWYELIILALSEAADIINYGRVEEVEEVEADSKGPQKQHHPSENFVIPLMFTLHCIIIYKYI